MRRLKILAIALCALPLPPTPASAIPAVLVAAHRGGADIAPENTVAAFRNAHALFAAHPGTNGWIEMDARLSSDNLPVVIHDDTLDRTTNCTGRVADRTALQLASCNAAESWPAWGFQGIATVRAVFEEAAAGTPWKIMIEIKDIPIDANFDAMGQIARELVAIVEDTGFPRANLIVQSFWPPFLDLVSLLDPAIPTMLLTTSTLPGAPGGVGFTLTENAGYATARGYEISAPDHETIDLTTDGVALAHALGRRVITWTVDSPTDRDRVLAAGVDGVITDDPNLMFE